SKKLLYEERSAAAEHFSPAVRQVIHQRQDIVQRLVVARRTAFAQSIGKVDARIISIVCIQVAARIVQRARPGERIQQVKTMPRAMLKLCLQGVIREKSLRKRLLNRGEG